ncbi:regulatory Fis family protein [Aquabacterium commune]|uniref:Regulatory Fis family protein n=1 Tax=Aquabacterium commune TaxID=70586 RepID=A0A4R6RHF0_9BURK|nr:sigma-54 dependent transcriptional regulator [Aquabacterium commune]TDP85770.1 regulatory Fis family protein [Aquabacterium commune]
MPAHALPDAPAEPDWPALHLHGSASAFRQSLALLQQCARVDATVLLCGETGTGKELAARALHYLSARSRGPFVPINCGALPDSILEAELFGHARGAFTDAKSDSLGVIGQAQGGTLFLDEIDAMSPRAQAAILRFAQDHSYRPLGASRLQHADVRLVAATNAKLEDLVAQGLFRQDLLFRINVLSVRLPPLRERHGDAALLAQAFVKRLVQQYRTDPKHIDAHSLALLQTPRAWPGNVRELEHLVHRAFLLAEGAVLHLDLGAPPVAAPVAWASVHEPDPAPTPAAIDPHANGGTQGDAHADISFADAKAQAITDFERRYLAAVLQRAGGNLSLAARIAGKERSRFCKLVRKHGLQRAGFDAMAD